MIEDKGDPPPSAVFVASLPEPRPILIAPKDEFTASPVIDPAEKLPEAFRATMVPAVLALVAVVAELETFPAVEMVASLVSAMAAEALMSASTITPEAIEVALPTEVTSPVRLALVVTVEALPVRLAVMVPAEKFPLASRATMALKVLALVAASSFVLSVADRNPAALVVAAECVWLPRATCVLLVPVGMRAMSRVPDVIADAACVWPDTGSPASLLSISVSV